MEQWIEKVGRYCSSLDGALPTGEDPRYSDAFSELKAEIEKKSDVDFDLIKTLCEQILIEQSKDLRVAAYLVLAMARLEGITGLMLGMALFIQLVETFGDKLYPVKPRARLAAIKWFQQEKVLTFAQSATTTVSHDDAVAALALYDAMFEKLSGLCEQPMSWPELKKWFSKEQEAAAPVVVPEKSLEKSPEKTPAPVVSSSPARPVAAPTANASIDSTTQYQQAVRQLLQYFKEQKLYGKAIGTAMACQWGNLKMPPNEQGKTRLPAPRDASQARIRNAVENEQWEEGLLACLDAFMEPSGQYCFDIPKWLFDCANNSRNNEAAAFVKSNVIQLFERFPKLAQLKFDNDEAFVSSTVAAWLEQLTEGQSDTGGGQSQSGYKEHLSAARTIAQEKSVQEAFTYFEQQPVKTELERAYINFCKAQLCVEQEKSELALPILLQLEKLVDQLSLQQVMPDFAMQVWRQLYRLQKDRLPGLEQESSRVETEKHLSHLQSLMCTTDVASAMQWL